MTAGRNRRQRARLIRYIFVGVILAGAVEPDTTLYDSIVSRAPEAHAIGDCTGLGLIRKATEDATRVGLRDSEPIVAETFAEADRATESFLDHPLSDYIFTDPTDTEAMAAAEGRLMQTAITQRQIPGA